MITTIFENLTKISQRMHEFYSIFFFIFVSHGEVRVNLLENQRVTISKMTERI